ncbi:unnamed protein product [Scytosiphon promiscuus]
MFGFLGRLFKGCSPDDTPLVECIKRYEESNIECVRLEGQLKEAQGRLQDVSQAKDATVSRIKGRLIEAQARLQDLSQEKEKACNERHQLRALLQAECKAKAEVAGKLAKYEDAAAARTLIRVENANALYLNKREIEMKIRQIVPTTAIEWAEEVSPKLDPEACVLPRLLAQVFSECYALVENRRLEICSFFLCGSNVEQTSAMEMDQDTADFMLRHMRAHFKTIFPLTGQHFEDAYGKIINRLATWVSATLESRTTEEAAQLLASSRLRGIVESYLEIVVSAALQQPRAEFTDDCGEEQAFDLKVHAESICGAHVKHGNSCVVVFPSFPPQKRFVLPAVQT